MPSISSTKSAALFALVSALFTQVAAHGFVEQVTVDGVPYEGFNEARWENNKPQGSAVLITNYLTPLYDVWSPAIACGWSPQAAQTVAPIDAGKSVGWKWMTHTASEYKTWTHDTGTHRSFIGSCKGDCKNVNPNDVDWIELSGEYTGQQNYENGVWPAKFLHDGAMWYDRIPNLPAGQYLLRNELTALHFSDQEVSDHGGAEFYPTCVAIEIKGTDGSFVPSTTYKFPGAYYVNQPGHYNPGFNSGNQGATVMAALGGGQGYSNSYSTTPTTNTGNTNTGNTGNTSGNDTPANNGSSSSSSTSPAAVSTPSPHVCKRGSRRSKAKKMRRSLKAHRRSEH